MLLLLVVVAAGASISAWRIAAARRAEHEEREKAEVANRELRHSNQRLEATVSLLELQRAEERFRAHDASSGVAYLAALLRRNASNAIAADRLIHVYGGGGHTTLVMGEMFFRAGGLANINPIMETGRSVFNQALQYL